MSVAFRVGSHEIYLGAPPMFMPDIGTFFNKDMSLAARMVDELVEAGVSAIKGEILHTAEICLSDSGNEVFWGHVSGSWRTENYRSLIERKVVPLGCYERLFGRCLEAGIDVVVSVYDFTGANFAKSLGLAALKIASSSITHQPLIEHVSALGLPVILDTGHSSLEEIGRAVSWASDAGATKLMVQHSPPAPPNELALHNLRFMNTIGAATGLPYGLSDHHAGDEMLYAAVAMGAVLIEKGVRPDALEDEQDASHALPMSEVGNVLRKIRNIHMAMGTGTRQMPRDRQKYHSRMGLVAKRDLRAGESISLETVTFAFPARGIAVEHWREVEGASLVRAFKVGEVIRWRDLHDFPL